MFVQVSIEAKQWKNDGPWRSTEIVPLRVGIPLLMTLIANRSSRAARSGCTHYTGPFTMAWNC
jgi:hypothetical protein